MVQKKSTNNVFMHTYFLIIMETLQFIKLAQFCHDTDILCIV